MYAILLSPERKEALLPTIETGPMTRALNAEERLERILKVATSAESLYDSDDFRIATIIKIAREGQCGT